MLIQPYWPLLETRTIDLVRVGVSLANPNRVRAGARGRARVGLGLASPNSEP
jgi:hypothetical protein